MLATIKRPAGGAPWGKAYGQFRRGNRAPRFWSMHAAFNNASAQFRLAAFGQIDAMHPPHFSRTTPHWPGEPRPVSLEQRDIQKGRGPREALAHIRDPDALAALYAAGTGLERAASSLVAYLKISSDAIDVSTPRGIDDLARAIADMADLAMQLLWCAGIVALCERHAAAEDERTLDGWYPHVFLDFSKLLLSHPAIRHIMRASDV